MVHELKKRLLITGWDGFLGKELANILHDSYDLILPNGDLNDIERWESSLEGASTIIHLAGCSYARDTKLYDLINSEGTRRLVVAAEKYGVERFIFASTRIKGACGPYGASKMKAEEYIRKSTLRSVIIRIAEVYDDTFFTETGVWRTGAIMQIAKVVQKSFIVPYLANPSATMAPVHKDDVVECFRAVIEQVSPENKLYTLAGTETLSMKEVVQRIVDKFGRKRVLVPIPLWIVRSFFWFASSVLNLGVQDQLRRLLCQKDSLSKNVMTDLGLQQRLFLANKA